MNICENTSESKLNPKLLKKQVTCNEANNEENKKIESILSPSHFNRTNSLSTENRAENMMSHAALANNYNYSESKMSANVAEYGSHLHRSQEVENLNLNEDEDVDNYIMINTKSSSHLKRTNELENLNEIVNDE